MGDNDTVPVSEMGIGDDEVEAELEQHAEKIREHWGGDVVNVDVNTNILAGAAHLHLTFQRDVDNLKAGLQNYLIASGLVMFDPRREGENLEVRATPSGVYDTWSDMEGPLEG